MFETLAYEFRYGQWVPIQKLVRCDRCSDGNHWVWVNLAREVRYNGRITIIMRALNFFTQGSLGDFIPTLKGRRRLFTKG